MNDPVSIAATTASSSPEETRQHAARLAAAGVRLVLLHGDLAAGKTEWAKGFVAALGATDPVTSPTFTLAHEYQSPDGPIHHWDLYRLEPGTDWDSLGLTELISGSRPILIEWPDRFPGPWPGHAWNVRIEWTGEQTRTLHAAPVPC